MKVKVTHEDSSVMIDIPANKVFVVIDKIREQEKTRSEVDSKACYFVESSNPEDVVELTTDEEAGILALFYNPVEVIEIRNKDCGDEILPSQLFATGWCTNVFKLDESTERMHMEEQYTKKEGGFAIVTSPRVLIDTLELTENMRANEERANVRYRSDMGNFVCSCNTRISSERQKELAEFLRVPRETGKSYAEHSLGDKQVEAEAIEFVKRHDRFFKESPFADTEDYWKQVAMNFVMN